MARRKPVETATSADSLILPRHLVEKTGLSADDFREMHRERRNWFRERGINPGDWSATYPILLASWKAHGIPSSAERARLRLGVADPRDVLRPDYTYPKTPTKGMTQ
jgi:hypothetical protein